MRRFASLVGKEVRQHAFALLGVALLLMPIEGLMLAGAAVSAQNLSYFEVQRSALLIFLPILGLILGTRLVVSEYYGRTQLFLEALPIRRWEPLVVKYLLGLAVMTAATLGLLAMTSLLAYFDEPLDPRFLLILTGRSLGFVIAGWSFLFMMGFTGRFRLALYLALVAALVAADEFTGFEFQRFGPILLIDETLPYERVVFPWAALVESLGVATTCLAVAASLALIGDGSIVEALAKRMSAREKGAVGAALLVGLMAYTTLLERRPEPDPYAFPEGTPMARSSDGRALVTFDDEGDRGAAEALLAAVEADTSHLRSTLGWEEAPIARVSLRETLDGDTFEPVRLAAGDGALVRANYTARDADGAELRATVARELITAHTLGRAVFEPQRWFLDGYARDLVNQGDAAARRESLWRALYATRDAPVDERALVAWNLTRERWGVPVAEGVAAVAVEVLRDEVGEDAVRRLARALYEEQPGDDSWVSLRYALEPFPAVFEHHTGLPLVDFVARVGRALDRQRASPGAAAVAAIPRLSATVSVEVVEGQLRAVAARVSQPEPRRGTTVATLLHHALEPLDDLLVELELERDDVAWPDGAEEAALRVEGRYGPGERAFFAVEVESAELGCPIRLAAERRTIR